jgi:hypothetical protein
MDIAIPTGSLFCGSIFCGSIRNNEAYKPKKEYAKSPTVVIRINA